MIDHLFLAVSKVKKKKHFINQLIANTISLNNFLGSRDSSLIRLWQAYCFLCSAKSLTRNFLIPPIFWEMEINFAKLVLFSFFYIYTLEKRWTVWIWLYIVDWHLLNVHLFSQSFAPQSPREQTRSVLSRCMSHCPLPLNCLSSVVLLPFQTGLLLCLLYTVSRWCWVLGVRLQNSWVSLTVHGRAQSSLVAWQ